MRPSTASFHDDSIVKTPELSGSGNGFGNRTQRNPVGPWHAASSADERNPRWQAQNGFGRNAEGWRGTWPSPGVAGR